MESSPPSILYLDTYTLADPERMHVPSSMSIGYGVTAGRVIRQCLTRHGFRLIRPLAETRPYSDGSRTARLRWVLRGYQRIVDAVITQRPDVVFIFHSFNAFPAEVRRILLELGSSIPVVGYTHGSHWDPSDVERMSRYPGLGILDLANLMALDQILFDSEFMLDTVVRNVRHYNATTADMIFGRSRVAGLPIDAQFIDLHRSGQRFSRITVVFNHAPVAAKNPVQFIRVMTRLMERFDINVLFTRAFGRDADGSEELTGLRARFKDRVIVGDNMRLEDYFRALWMSDIQVSTASHESLGVATLEAMYTENCCLMPFRGSYPEICAGNDEVLYRGNDDLERRLSHFITSPEARSAVGKVLASQARTYTAEAVGPRIIDALEDALELSRGRKQGPASYAPVPGGGIPERPANASRQEAAGTSRSRAPAG